MFKVPPPKSRMVARATASVALFTVLFQGLAGAQASDRVPAKEVFPARSERVVPNVPDRHGCVKECEFDRNPCDTPLEKKLDGRCTLRG